MYVLQMTLDLTSITEGTFNQVQFTHVFPMPLPCRKNVKPAKLMESYRINPSMIPSSGTLCGQPNCQETTAKNHENFYSKASTTVLNLPLLNIKEMEVANKPRFQAEDSNTHAQEGHSQVLNLPVLNSKDVETVSSTEKFWMPNDAVFQHRNNSASMHHSRGYYGNYKRPTCSQQTPRTGPVIKRQGFQPLQGPAPIRTHPMCCSQLVQAKNSGTFQLKAIPAPGASDRNQESSSKFQDIELAGKQVPRLCTYQQQGQLLPSSSGKEGRLLQARLLSKAGVFFSNNTDVNEDQCNKHGGAASMEDDSKLPKLPTKVNEPSLQQESKFSHVSLPNISSKPQSTEQSSEPASTAMRHVLPHGKDSKLLENTASSGAVATGTVTSTCNRLDLKSPKRWEEEYLRQAPRSFIFSRQHMLFSMETVNKRLLENGISKPGKKERIWLQPKRTKHTGDRHRSTLDEGELEAPFGIMEKPEGSVSSKCFIKSMERQKSKRASKIITGRSGLCSNIPPNSQKVKITLHGRSCKVPGTARRKVRTYSEDSEDFTYE